MKLVTPFENLVYEATKMIPKGQVSTYLEIARSICHPKSYRAVGNALNKNPFAPIVPCHRVVASNGSLGGFSFGVNKKITILRQEGVEVKENKVINFKEKLFTFRNKK